jgi:hypothetical protein
MSPFASLRSHLAVGVFGRRLDQGAFVRREREGIVDNRIQAGLIGIRGGAVRHIRLISS